MGDSGVISHSAFIFQVKTNDVGLADAPRMILENGQAGLPHQKAFTTGIGDFSLGIKHKPNFSDAFDPVLEGMGKGEEKRDGEERADQEPTAIQAPSQNRESHEQSDPCAPSVGEYQGDSGKGQT